MAVVDGQKRSSWSWRLRFKWANPYSKRTVICVDRDCGKVDKMIGSRGGGTSSNIVDDGAVKDKRAESDI